MPDSAVHPYIPNSVPRVRAQMLREIGVEDVAGLYADIPERLRFSGTLALPLPLHSELELRRHVEEMLARNHSCADTLSFLGGGCWQHHVPAVCDEIGNRAEFVTAYYGETYTDHGKLQALFECASLIGELVELDAVSQPTYDWASAAASAMAMAARITGRNIALVPATLAPERRSVIQGYCEPRLRIQETAVDLATGQLDLGALERAMTPDVACVYLENPAYLGTLETRAPEIADLAHAAGALCVVGVDAVSLGVLEAPPRYGADIVCGELQGLGVRMHFGGGLAGFIATPDEERYVVEYPTFLIGLAPTVVPGEYGFGEVMWERISYVQRGESSEYAGTTQNLWAIVAAVYLSLLGPQGLAELGQGIMQRSQYTAKRLSQLPGVTAPALAAPFFKEFVVRFDDTGKTVADINAHLRERGIFGGKNLSAEFPALGQSALYCVTEIHTQRDIDRLVDALGEVIS
jgi:glycine cleavage system P protein (glycine dehydrogenase) subunit 1